MKTGLLRKGLLSVALAVALLMSLMPLTALADDPVRSAGDPEYTLTLTGYEYGKRITGVSAMLGDLECFNGIYEDENIVTATSDARFNANKQYYLSVRFDVGSPDGISGEDVALMLNGTLCQAKKVTPATGEAAFIAVFELPKLQAIPSLIPFTKIVEQTGNVAPGEGSFELEVANVYKEETNSPIVEFDVDGAFFTEGAGSMEKYLSIENDDFTKVLSLLDEGILVSEKNFGAEGWSYDDAVWFVRFGPDLASLTDDSQSASNPLDNYLSRLEFYKGKMVDGVFVADSQDDLVSADKMIFTNSYNETDPVVSLTLPFVKKVTQGGAMTPGKETFKFEIFGIGNSDVEGYADVTYTAAVETNGKGDFEGELTITGPASQVELFICEGFFVREVKGTAEGWTYSDAVWFVDREWIESEDSGYAFTPILGEEVSNGNLNDEVEPQMALVVYPTTCEVDELGEKHYIPAEESVAKMSFENVYTAAAPATLAKTGDSTNAGLLVAALFVSGLVVTGAAYGARRKLAE